MIKNARALIWYSVGEPNGMVTDSLISIYQTRSAATELFLDPEMGTLWRIERGPHGDHWYYTNPKHDQS